MFEENISRNSAKTIRLFSIGFYEAIVDLALGLINYNFYGMIVDSALA